MLTIEMNFIRPLCEFMYDGKGADTIIKRLVRMIFIIPFFILAAICCICFMIIMFIASPFIYLFTGTNIYNKGI